MNIIKEFKKRLEAIFGNRLDWSYSYTGDTAHFIIIPLEETFSVFCYGAYNTAPVLRSDKNYQVDYTLDQLPSFVEYVRGRALAVRSRLRASIENLERDSNSLEKFLSELPPKPVS